MKMIKNIFYLSLLLLICGCSYLGGFEDLGEETVQEYNQKIETAKLQNNTLNSSNPGIAKALVDSINSLNQLQGELDLLQEDIDKINLDIENLSQDSNLDPETITYLNSLNELTLKSKKFVSSLYESTKIWDSYLSSQSYNPYEFTEINDTQLIDSVSKPLDAFTE